MFDSANPSEEPPVGRLAPSPTGLLHIGHARSFLLTWWHLRSVGGRVLMRIEDLDPERSRLEFRDALLRDLEWLGLDWDGAVDHQSEAAEGHAEALRELIERDLVYPCICTRAELRQTQSAPQAGTSTERYPGTCRDRFDSIEDAVRFANGRQPALRFRVPVAERPVEFEDGVHGAFEQDVRIAVGDFPVSQRRPGAASYQLAVVLDDARQGVTWVHRGDDLLDSTPRQILLQRALVLPRPRGWFHFPLVHDDEGQRLAKRTAGLALATLREEGVDPRALVAWVARSAGIRLPQGQLITPKELLAAQPLRPEEMPLEPVRFGSVERISLAQID